MSPESTTDLPISRALPITPLLVLSEKHEQRQYLQSTLSRVASFPCKACENSEQAMNMLLASPNQFHVIVMKWLIGQAEHPVFVQQIRSDVRTDHVNFVLMNGAIPPEDLFLLAELDIRHHVSEEPTGDEVLNKLKELISEQHAVEGLLPRIRQLTKEIAAENVTAAEKALSDHAFIGQLKRDPKFLHIVGELHIVTKKFSEAIEIIQEQLRSQSPSAETLKSLSVLGKALCLSGRYSEGLVVFERLAAKSPKNLNHRISRGDALLGLDRVEEAKEQYRDVLQAQPGNKKALMGMGKAAVAEGDLDNARSFFSQIDGSFEDYSLASFFNNRAVAMVRVGNVHEAIQFYENAIEFVERYRGHVLFNLGLAHLRLGQKVEATKRFTEAASSKDISFLKGKSIIKLVDPAIAAEIERRFEKELDV